MDAYENILQGVNALLRAGCSVDFLTNHHVWRWNHFRGKELRVNFFKPKGAQDVSRASEDSLYILVKGPAMDVSILEKFLFLRIPLDTERIRPVDSADVAKLGTVLTSKKFSHKLYVAGIYVQDDKRLYYGYDIPNLRLTRDREVPNSYTLAERISDLWSNLIPVSSPARTRYLDLFETSPKSLDVYYAKYDISLVAARALFEELQKRHPGCWFCRASSGAISHTDAVIIQNCLKLKPKGLQEDLWGILCDRFHLVTTAEDERKARFAAAPPTKIISSPTDFAAHTLHLLRIFLALDEATRNISVSFVDGDEFQGLEYVLETLSGSTQYLINDSNLRATSVDHPACLRYHYLPIVDKKVVVPDDYTCSCSAIKLANYIYDEALQSRSSYERHRLGFFRQNLVYWIPITISSESSWGESDNITSVKLSWSTLWSKSDLTFNVIIYDVSLEVRS